jgi:hypothetical protein
MFRAMSDLILDYAALAAAGVNPDPFPHLLVHDFVPAASLRQIQADVPDVTIGGSFPPKAVKLGPMARQLMAEMEGPRLKSAIAQKFGLNLDDAPTMLTMRLHCREKDGQIHTDSRAKRVTVLLYLNPEDAFADRNGCLRLLRGPDDLENYAAEVPPTNGTLLVFPNSPASWHGHHSFAGRRLSVQLNYMTSDGLARSELRRHKLSALWKRLTRAA